MTNTNDENNGAAPEPLTLQEPINVNRLALTFLESAWRGDEESGQLVLAQLEPRELRALLGALAGMAHQALATTAHEDAFIRACRVLLDRAEADS